MEQFLLIVPSALASVCSRHLRFLLLLEQIDRGVIQLGLLLTG